MLTACGERSADAPANDTASPVVANEAAKPATKPAPAAKPSKVEEETSLYNFTYNWSAEAAAIPELVKRFTADKDKVKAELVSDAKADRDERLKEGFPFNAYETQKSYETAGETDRLLSLELSVYSFTGGAHGSSGSGSLICDRVLTREVSIHDMLLPGASWTAAIRQPFCVLLNREREKRREEPVKPDDMFGNCPEYKELTVIPADTDKNGRFDHLNVTADQYVAGPYVEGDYEIALPVTAMMIERLKPEYRPSFEPRPGVK